MSAKQDAVTTLRISKDLKDRLQSLSEILGVPKSEINRIALLNYIDEREKEIDFKRRLEERIKHDQKILKGLS